jgi:tRNA threonylcarbamoyladenosine biosynthesis protein TsaB
MNEGAREPIVLALDSAGLACSALVAVGGVVLCAKRLSMEHGQAEALVPLIDAAMREAGLAASELHIVGTTIGPGSFTGIRIGLAASRGIALATSAQLIGVTGFEAVAAGLVSSVYDRGARFLLVALESRREDLYVQLFDPKRNPLGAPMAAMPAMLDETLNSVIGSTPLVVAGDAAPRVARVLSRRPGTTVAEGSAPNATGVLRAVLHRWRLGLGASGSLPLYLRPPDVTIPTGRGKGNH